MSSVPSRNRFDPRRIPEPKVQECELEEAAQASVILEPCGDQPVDGLLVDPHDLVDLDLLAGNIDRCLAKAGNSTPSVIDLPSSTSLATATIA